MSNLHIGGGTYKNPVKQKKKKHNTKPKHKQAGGSRVGGGAGSYKGSTGKVSSPKHKSTTKRGGLGASTTRFLHSAAAHQQASKSNAAYKVSNPKTNPITTPHKYTLHTTGSGSTGASYKATSPKGLSKAEAKANADALAKQKKGSQHYTTTNDSAGKGIGGTNLSKAVAKAEGYKESNSNLIGKSANVYTAKETSDHTARTSKAGKTNYYVNGTFDKNGKFNEGSKKSPTVTKVNKKTYETILAREGGDQSLGMTGRLAGNVASHAKTSVMSTAGAADRMTSSKANTYTYTDKNGTAHKAVSTGQLTLGQQAKPQKAQRTQIKKNYVSKAKRVEKSQNNLALEYTKQANYKAGQSALGKLALDTTGQMTEMGIDYLAGAALAGTAGAVVGRALASAIGANGALANMGLRSFTGGYDQAIADGATEKEANVFGWINAATEVATEKMWNVGSGFEKLYGKGIMNLDKFIPTASGRFVKSQAGKEIVSGLKTLGLSGGTEALEEIVGNGIEDSLGYVTYQKQIGERDQKALDSDVAMLENNMGGSLPNNLKNDAIKAGQTGKEVDLKAIQAKYGDRAAAMYEQYMNAGSAHTKAEEYSHMDWKGMAKDQLNSALIAGLSGILMGGGSVASTYSQGRTINADADAKSSLYSAATQYGGEQSGRIVSRLQNQQASGQEVSNMDTGKLAEAINSDISARRGSGTYKATQEIVNSHVKQADSVIAREYKTKSDTPNSDMNYHFGMSILESAVDSGSYDANDYEPSLRQAKEVKDTATKAYLSMVVPDMNGDISDDANKSADIVADAVAAISTGHASTDEIMLFGTSNPENRKVLESTLGIKLPMQDAATYAILSQRNADSKIMFAKQDSKFITARDIDEAFDLPGEAQAFSKTVKDTGKRDITQLTDYFNMFYHAGMAGRTRAEAQAKFSKLSPLTSQEEFSAWYAGKKAHAYRNTAAPTKSSEPKGKSVQPKKTTPKKGKYTVDKEVTEADKNKVPAAFSRLAKLISRKYHVDIVLMHEIKSGEGKLVNGAHTGNTIMIAANQADTTHILEGTLMHELTHQIESLAPAEYEKMKKYVMKHWRANNKISFEHAVSNKMSQYKGTDTVHGKKDAADEIMAEWAVSILQDEKAVKEFLGYDATLGQKITDAIKKFFEEFTAYIKSALGATSPAYLKASGVEAEFKKLWLGAAKAAENGTREYHGTPEERRAKMPFVMDDNTIGDKLKRRTKFSLPAEDSEGRKLTDDQQNYFSRSKVRLSGNRLAEVYHTTSNGGFTIFDAAFSDDKTSLFFTDDFNMSASYANGHNDITEMLKDDVDPKELENTKGYYVCYLNLTNPLEIDCNGAEWDDIPEQGIAELIITRDDGSGAYDMDSAELGPLYYVSYPYDGLDNEGMRISDIEEEFGEDVAEKVRNSSDEEVRLYRNYNDSAYDEFTEEEPESGNTRHWCEVAKANGYDGVIFNDLKDNGLYGNFDTGNVYVAFDSNQVKSIYNEHPTKDDNIRYSVAEDSEGRKLTDDQIEYFKNSEARDDKGRLMKLYHGTDMGGFTIFEPGISDDRISIFMTDSPSTAASYSNSKEEIIPFIGSTFKDAVNWILDERNGVDVEIETYHGTEKIKTYYTMNEYLEDYPLEEYPDGTKDVQSIVIYNVESGNEINECAWTRELAEKLDESDFTDGEYVSGLYPVYVNLENPYVLNCHGQNWDEITEEGFDKLTASRSSYTDDNSDEMYYDVRSMVTGDFDIITLNTIKERYGEDAARIVGKYGGDFWTYNGEFYNDENEENVENDFLLSGSTREWSRMAYRMGYDGIIFKDIVDNGPYSDGTDDANVYVSFIGNNAIKSIYNEHPTNDDDIRYSVADDQKLTREQETRKLAATVERLRGEMKLTHNAKPNKADIRREANYLCKFYVSNVPVQDVENSLTEMYEILARGGGKQEGLSDADMTEFSEYAMDIAEDIVENGGFVTDEGSEELIEAKKYFKGQHYAISKEEAFGAGFGDYNEFKRYMFGHGIYVIPKRTTFKPEYTEFDGMERELYEEYPGIFTPGSLDNPVGNNIQYVIQNVLEPAAERFYKFDLHSEEGQEMTVDIAEHMAETLELIKPKRTFADRKKAEKEKAVSRTNKKWKEREEKHKAAYLDKIGAMKAQMTKKLAAEKDKNKKKTAELKSKSAEEKRAIRDKNTDRKNRKGNIESIKGSVDYLTKALLNPSDTVHLPMGYEAGIARVLYGIDLETHRMDKYAEKHGISRTVATFRRLESEYKSMIARENENEPEADGIILDVGLPDIISRLADTFDGESETLGRVRLENMDSASLADLRKLMSALRMSIQHINSTFYGEQRAKVAEQGDAVISELANLPDDMKGAAIHGTSDFLNTSNAKPTDFFERMGSPTLMRAFNNIIEAQDTSIRHFRESMDYIESLTKDLNLEGSDVYKWHGARAEIESFKLSNGKTAYLTVGQKMELYALMQRKQAVGHILGSGIEIESQKYKGSKIKSVPKVRTRITYEETMNIIKSLTPEQREFADSILTFLQTTCADWGNETSRRMFGYEKFGESNYYPIHTSRNYIAETSNPAANVPKLINGGATKATVIGANNPIVIGDFFDTVTTHIDFMTKYNAYVPAITDMERLLNYTSKDESTNLINNSVKSMIDEKYGKSYNKYIRQLLSDINTKRAQDNDFRGVDKLLRWMKANALALNLRVLVQQPTSIARANYYINSKHLIQSAAMMKGFSKKETKRMWDICPLSFWKHLGFAQTDISRPLNDILFNRNNIYKKLAFDPYGAADDVTWRTIFGAVELETKAKMKKGELSFKYDDAEYRKYVNERCRYIFDRSQVVDTTLHRAQIMRHANPFVKSVTSFMSEPLTNWNMTLNCLSEARKLKRAGKTGDAIKLLNKGLAVYLTAGITLSLIASLISTMRQTNIGGDDEKRKKKRFIEQWLGKWGLDGIDITDSYLWHDIKSNMNPVYWLPIVGDAVDEFMNKYTDGRVGFTPNQQYLQLFDVLATGLKDTRKLIDGSYKDTENSKGYYLQQVAESLSAASGISIKNARRDAEALARAFVWGMGSKDYANYLYDRAYLNPEKNKSEVIGTYLSLQSKDKDHAKDMYKWMTKGGITKDDISSYVRTKYSKKLEKAVMAHDVDEVKKIMKTERKYGIDTDTIKQSIKTSISDDYKKTFENNDIAGRHDIDKLLRGIGYSKLQVKSHRLAYAKGYSRYKCYLVYRDKGYDACLKACDKAVAKYPGIYQSGSRMVFGIKNLTSYSKKEYDAGKWSPYSPSGKYSYANVNKSSGKSSGKSSSGSSGRHYSSSNGSSGRHYSSSGGSGRSSSGGSAASVKKARAYYSTATKSSGESSVRRAVSSGSRKTALSLARTYISKYGTVKYADAEAMVEAMEKEKETDDQKLAKKYGLWG